MSIKYRRGVYPKVMGAITLLENSVTALDRVRTFAHYKLVMDDLNTVRTLIEDYAMVNCPDFIDIYVHIGKE